jgi:uncharacterized protein YbjT (DUF2867 family)
LNQVFLLLVTRCSQWVSLFSFVVQADADSKEGLASLFKGATVAVIIPPAADRVEVSLKYVAAAATAKVQFFTLVSVLAAARKPSSTFGKQFTEIEAGIEKTGIPFSFIRLPMFMENQWGNTGSIKGASAFYYPVKPESRFVHISVADIGAAVAAVSVASDKHKNTKYSVVGDETSAKDMAAIYSKITGKTVNFYQAAEVDAVKAMLGFGMPDWQAKGVVELWNMADAGEASLAKDGDVFKALTGRAATTTEAFLNGIGFAFKADPIIIAVTGATGNTGFATVKSITSENKDVKVRVAVRDAKKADKFKGLANLEVVTVR